MNVLTIKIGEKKFSTLIEDDSYGDIRHGCKQILRVIFNVSEKNLIENLIIGVDTKTVTFWQYSNTFEISSFIV